MSHSGTKKSVFDRIGGNSSSPSATTNASNKSTHGFCNAFIKTGTCPLGDTCKFIHEQPNLDKAPALGEEFRITKTITRVVDMSPAPIKSMVTVSNEQRPVVVSNSMHSNRTVIESVTTPTDHPDRRLSGSDRRQSQSRHSDSKHKSPSISSGPSKNKTHSSSLETRHSSKKKQRTAESDSSISSASDSGHVRSSRKHKKKSNHSAPSKHRKHESVSPPIHDAEETLNAQLFRQTQVHGRSPKRTIVIAKKRKDDDMKQATKESKSKSVPEIEFLGSKKVKPEKKSIETIHQQAENNKKSSEVKREKKSPGRSTSEQQRRHSSSTNASSTSTAERNIQVKLEDNKHPSNKAQNSSERYERSDRHAPEGTPPVVQLSPAHPIPAASETPEKSSTELVTESEKLVVPPPPSPICVILDDDSSPAPSIDRKDARQASTTSAKKTNEPEKNDVKPSKRSRDSEKTHEKEKTSASAELKRKRLNDGSVKKVTSSSKTRNESHSTSNRADVRRGANTSSREDSSSRKHKENSEAKSSRSTDSKDRNSAKSRGNLSRRDPQRSSPEKKRSALRHGTERENVTDSEEHLDESTLPKQTAIEAYMAMDWSSLSRDKRIPFNSQVTSRIARMDNGHSVLNASERLLTPEQKEQLQGVEFQSLPLTHFMKQLQSKSTPQIITSCRRRFGSCAKDMIEMKHKWFTRSIEPVQRYEFINKEHFVAFQQAINSLLDKTSSDPSTVQIETAVADVLLS